MPQQPDPRTYLAKASELERRPLPLPVLALILILAAITAVLLGQGFSSLLTASGVGVANLSASFFVCGLMAALCYRAGRTLYLLDVLKRLREAGSLDLLPSRRIVSLGEPQSVDDHHPAGLQVLNRLDQVRPDGHSMILALILPSLMLQLPVQSPDHFPPSLMVLPIIATACISAWAGRRYGFLSVDGHRAWRALARVR